MDPLQVPVVAPGRCPICGRENDCAEARGRPGDAPCWCRAITIGPDVLQRVPREARGKSCVCAACAAGR